MSGTVVAIGNFDGVHRGHQGILRTARDLAGGGRVIALTFWPHPLSVLAPERAPDLLAQLPERIRLLRRSGADQVRVVQFTRQVSAWSPSQFVSAVLGPLAPEAVVVGENFRFGHGAQADGHDLANLAGGEFDVVVLPMLSDAEPLSSSRIRQALEEGDPTRAGRMLGRWFRYGGIVVQGDQRGRQLGFPTANLTVAGGRACPADGVYAGWLVVAAQDGRERGLPDPATVVRDSALTDARTTPTGRAPAPRAQITPSRAVGGPAGCGGADEEEWRWPAALNVGSNPTFDGLERRVEAHALDQSDLDLYGVKVGVDFVERLRPTVRFDGLEALVAQLVRDVAATRQVLAGTPDGPFA